MTPDPGDRSAKEDVTPADRIAGRGLLIAALGLSALIFFVNRRFYEDDALITLRYCTNLLRGHGLVWNAGERVEGYSNFLFLILVAALGTLKVDLVTASRCVAIASFVGIAIVIFRYTASDRRAGRASRAALPLIITLTSCPLVVWSLGGMEGPLCALLALGGLSLVAHHLSADRPSRLAAAGALFALATMTRIDACMFVPPAVLCLLAFNRTGQDARRGAIGAASLAGAFAAVYVPYFAWRYHYYGDLLPNTFYAKGTSTDVHTLVGGLRYVLGMLARPPVLGLWLGAAVVVAVKRRSVSPRLIYVGLTATSYLLFPVLAGGDWMPAARFMVPVIPVLALVIFEALCAANWPRTPARTQAVGVALLVACALQLLIRPLNPVHSDPSAYLGRIVGGYVKQHWPAGALVAIGPAGAVPFAALDLRFVDTLGLNDRYIAHSPTRHLDLVRTQLPGHRKGDGAYVLSRHPDFIILGPPEGTTLAEPWWVSDYEMGVRRAEFDKEYREERVDLDVHDLSDHETFTASASGKLHFVYYRRVGSSLRPL